MGMFSADERDVLMGTYVPPVPPDVEILKRVYSNGHTVVKIVYRKNGKFIRHEVAVAKGKVNSLGDIPSYLPLRWFPSSQSGWSQALQYMETL